MRKKAIISISSTQANDKQDAIEVVTPGEFLVNSKSFEAIYDETEISGMEGTKTKLVIYPNSILLEREGTTATKMDFKKDNSSVSLYNTPYGILELKINTKELKIDVDENGGEVFINYNLGVGDEKPMDTELKIKIKV